MKLTVLVDNNTTIDRYFLGEPALSFLIEDGEERVLFDAGYSDAFVQNAAKIGVCHYPFYAPSWRRYYFLLRCRLSR